MILAPFSSLAWPRSTEELVLLVGRPENFRPAGGDRELAAVSSRMMARTAAVAELYRNLRLSAEYANLTMGIVPN